MKKLSLLYTAYLPKQVSQSVCFIALLALVLTCSAFSFVPSAHAFSNTQASSTIRAAVAVPDDSNGQQLEVETLAFSVKITGPNQHGTTVTHCFNTPNYDTELPGWWWKGSIKIWAYDGADCTSSLNEETTRYIPTSFSGDYYPVQVNPY